MLRGAERIGDLLPLRKRAQGFFDLRVLLKLIIFRNGLVEVRAYLLARLEEARAGLNEVVPECFLLSWSGEQLSSHGKLANDVVQINTGCLDFILNPLAHGSTIIVIG